MDVRYKQDIFHAIVTEYFENNSDGRSWTDLYNCVKQSLGRNLSARDFSSHVENMIGDRILWKDDPGGRGKRVSISLTKRAMRLYRLGILGQNKQEVKNKKILQLLIFFHKVKPPNLISTNAFEKILSSLSLSRKDLVVKSHFHILATGYTETNYKPVKDYRFRIVEVYDGERKTTHYYCGRISFSIEDIIKYTKKYKQVAIDNTRIFPRHISAPKLTKEDIKKEFDTLRWEGIIRPTQNIFDKPGKQVAFLIADDNLQDLISQVWSIRNLELERLQIKLTYLEGPTKAEKEWLELTYGSNQASIIIHNTSLTRNEKQNRKNSNIENRIESLTNRINQRMLNMSKAYRKVIKKFDFPLDILDGICLNKIVLT